MAEVRSWLAFHPSCMPVCMHDRLTALERAFQLAKSARCASIEEIDKILKREGYSPRQTAGPAVRRQIKELIRCAQESQSVQKPRSD
jgi:hypothetical protein